MEPDGSNRKIIKNLDLKNEIIFVGLIPFDKGE
jgi:hypothetical protein